MCTGALAWAEDAAPVQAIWKDQEIAFYFQSYTTFYTCDGLEAAVERVMKALGAQEVKARVRSAECPGGVARAPRVVVELNSPVPATAEAIAERDKTRSTRELTARVKGKRASGTENETFVAHWRPVSPSRGALRLEPGDCELIDELKRKVLPRLAVRIVNDNLSCPPRQVAIGQPNLEVEALIAAARPDDATKSDASGEEK